MYNFMNSNTVYKKYYICKEEEFKHTIFLILSIHFSLMIFLF